MNSTFTSGLTLVGSSNLPSLSVNGTSTVSSTINLCGIGLANGTYYIGYWIDDLNQVSESNENDNIWYWGTSPITITCGCTAPSAPTAVSPGTSSAPGSSSSSSPTLQMASNGGTIQGYDPRISQCPYGSTNIIWSNSCTGTNVSASSLPTGNLYRWNADASCDCAGTNSGSTNTLYFNVPPVITYSGTTSFCSGNSLVMNTTAGNTASTPTYQWYKDGSSVGSNSSSYTATQTGTYTVAISYSCGSTDQSSGVSVLVNPAPSQPGSISGSTSVCSGNSITYTVPYVSGVNYSWSLPLGWSGSSTSNSITILTVSSSGTISVTAGNSCGTSMASTLHVTVNSPPSVLVNASPSTVCPNQQVTYTASGANSYSWSGVSGNGPIATTTYPSPGTYTVTATGNPGSCSATAAASVTVNPSASFTITAASNNNNIFCSGQSLTLTASNNSFSYQWGNNATQTTSYTTTATPSSNQTYYATATNTNNCTSTASVNVTVNPTVTPTVSLSQSPNPVCTNGNNSVTITANPSNQLYTWSNSGGTRGQYTISNITSGAVVSCTLTSNVECASPTTATATINIQVTPPATPTLTITTPSNTVCEGNATFNSTETSGGNSPSYTWSVNGVAQPGSLASFNYDFTANGSYTVSCFMTASSDACTNSTSANSNTLNITVQNQAPSSVQIITNDSIVCAGSQVIFNTIPSNGGSTPQYQWLINASPITGTTNSSYSSSSLQNGDIVTCSMTSNSTCATNIASVSNAITITVNPLPTAVVCCDTSVCAGDQIMLAASGGLSCLWHGIADSNSCSPIITPTANTTYSATVSSSNGCSASGSVHVSIISPMAPSAADSVGSTVYIDTNYTVCFYNKSSNSTSVHWDFGDGKQSNISNPCHTFSSSCPFIVTLTAYNSCGTTTDSNSTQFIICPEEIAEIGRLQNLSVVPNPSSGSFIISFDATQAKHVQIKIYDLIGQIIRTEDPVKVSGSYTKQINLGNVAKGVYILQIMTGEEMQNRRIEVQ